MSNTTATTLAVLSPNEIYPTNVFRDTFPADLTYALNWLINELGTNPFVIQTWGDDIWAYGSTGVSVLSSWKAPIVSSEHDTLEVAVYAKKTVSGDTMEVGLIADNNGTTASNSVAVTTTSFAWYFFEVTMPNVSTTALTSDDLRVGLFADVTGTPTGDLVVGSLTVNYKKLVTSGNPIAYVTGGLISGVEPFGLIRSKNDMPFTAHIARQVATALNVLKDRRKVLMNWSATDTAASRTLATAYGTTLDDFEIGGPVVMDRTGRPLSVLLRMETQAGTSLVASVAGRDFEYTAGAVDNWTAPEDDSATFTTAPGEENTLPAYVNYSPGRLEEWLNVVTTGEGNYIADTVHPHVHYGFDGTTGVFVEQQPDDEGTRLFADMRPESFVIGGGVNSQGLQQMINGINALYHHPARLAYTVVRSIEFTAGNAPCDLVNLKSYSHTDSFAVRIGTRTDSGKMSLLITYYRDTVDTSTILTVTAKTTAGATVDSWSESGPNLPVGRLFTISGTEYTSRNVPGKIATLDVSAQQGNYVIFEVTCYNLIPLSYTIYEDAP